MGRSIWALKKVRLCCRPLPSLEATTVTGAKCNALEQETRPRRKWRFMKAKRKDLIERAKTGV
ncbi:hypothetical protein F2Q70_00033017 [Brassica cretica]|uniref:Uncharacterized protein n=1 Tax=Brassica cretica TaxID=69181 RepID=A0A8S9FLT2_BRACR|nr:hypothetical protein F2Q70_00033017 [Brassica cretica]